VLCRKVTWRTKQRLAASTLLLAAAGRAQAQTYYVSPSGNDNNSGLSPSQPWQTLNKVDATNFSPGSNILLQAGGQWYGTLSATSSGTTTAPITYGSYGSGPNPIIWGSNVLDAGNFQQLPGTSNSDPTYSMNYSTTVNSVLEDHQFLNSATLADTVAGSSPAPSTYVSYVESTPDTWYYDATPNVDELYVNTGTTISPTDGHVYTAAVRENLVSNSHQSNLVFENLTVEESADANAGYGFQIQNGDNVTIRNSTAIATGKHAFSVIDSTGFVGENLTASYSMPDQGYGGASAFVSYSDDTRVGDTSSWVNTTFTNPNGPYPAFISHGDPYAIGSLNIVNMSGSGYGTGIVIYQTSPTEAVSIQGGSFYNGFIDVSTNNTTINGMTISGQYSQVDLSGDNDILQNSVITGTNQDTAQGQDGAVYLSGTGDIVRFNTFEPSSSANKYSPIIGVDGAANNTQIYGNIFDTNGTAFLYLNYTGAGGSISSNNNLFSSQATHVFMLNGSVLEPFSQWQQMGQDANSTVGTPSFAQTPAGSFYLLLGSPGIGTFVPTSAQAVPTDIYGNPRPAVGSAYNVGAVQPVYDPSAPIDIGTSGILINYASAASDPISIIQSALRIGYNGGTWTGNGIVSSAAAADPQHYAIGYADGDNAADAANTGIPAGELEVIYTLSGDANLSGTVDLSDLVIVAADFGMTDADWAQGDVNYDGNVDLSDLVIIASNFGASLSSAQSADFGSNFAAEWQLALAETRGADVTVPEPAGAVLACAAIAGLLIRGRTARGVGT
jgi:hypothetical protein